VSAKEVAKWTFEAMESWIRDTFAKRADTMTREEYERRHDELRRQHDEDIDRLQKELLEFHEWKANLMGRAIAVGLVGTIFITAVTAIIVHLIQGG
jgi:hypothetical protein